LFWKILRTFLILIVEDRSRPVFFSARSDDLPESAGALGPTTMDSDRLWPFIIKWKIRETGAFNADLKASEAFSIFISGT
jgi:hypothetical protein